MRKNEERLGGGFLGPSSSGTLLWDLPLEDSGMPNPSLAALHDSSDYRRHSDDQKPQEKMLDVANH